mmetsp:Transcript_42489/g.104498  ORF Transcript_42489/g.104498 Transcript_42489/m.104498 type:complete len:389 (-) Transcript_42489:76-1242(-)
MASASARLSSRSLLLNGLPTIPEDQASANELSAHQQGPVLLGFNSSRLPSLEADADEPGPGPTLASAGPKNSSVNRFSTIHDAKAPLSPRRHSQRLSERMSGRMSGRLSLNPSTPSERSKTMSHPAVPYADMGTTWGSSLVVFPNNALRREIRNLYTIFTSLEGCGEVVESEPVEQFFQWYAEFQKFLDLYIDAHETVLFPLAEKAGPLPGGLAASGRKSAHSRLRHLASLVSKSEQRTLEDGFMSSHEVLRRAIDKLALVIIGYCNEQEKVLPELLDANAPKKGRDQVTRTYVRAYLDSTAPHIFAVILGAWTQDLPGNEGSKVLQTWKHNGLGRTYSVKYGFWEKSYQRDKIVKQFSERASKMKAATPSGFLSNGTSFTSSADSTQ